MNRQFKAAKLGTVSVVRTVIYIASAVFFIVRVATALSAGAAPLPLDLFACVLLIALTIYGYVRSVRGYELQGENVVVTRAGPGRVLIPLGDLKSVQFRPTIGEFFNVRLLSIEGLFGYAGRAKVRNPTDINSLEALVYGTDPRKSVVIELKDGRTFVLTPDQPEEFVTVLRDSVVGAEPPAEAPVARTRRRRGQ